MTTYTGPRTKLICAARGCDGCIVCEETPNPELQKAADIMADAMMHPILRSMISRTEAYEKGVQLFLAGHAHGHALGFAEGVEAAAKVAEECGRSNVENPAIDMFERIRRQGIRWCGEFSIMRIRALLHKEKP